MLDEHWCANSYVRVYAAIVAALDAPTRSLAPGTSAQIGRAIDHFRGRGAAREIAALEAMSLVIAMLHDALRAQDERAQLHLRHVLSIQARTWLLAAPIGAGMDASEPLHLAA